MELYDEEILERWTPRELDLRITGARYRQVDRMEELSFGAIFQRVATNSKKKIKPRDLFNADKARKQIEKGDPRWRAASSVQEQSKQTRVKKLRSAMNKWDPMSSFKPKEKGGNT